MERSRRWGASRSSASFLTPKKSSSIRAQPPFARSAAARISIVYLGPGLGADIEVIRDALEPLSILTVSANPEDVSRGIVLGFDLVYGKPKLVVNLGQARKQHVDLMAEVLKMMRVIGA